MFFYARIYHFYRRALLRAIRLFVFAVLLLIIWPSVEAGGLPKIPLFLFNLFVIWEIFFHFKIGRVMPSLTIEKNQKKDPYLSFTLQAILPFVEEVKTGNIIRKIVKYPQIKAIMQKADIEDKDLNFPDVPVDLLAQSAFETARTFRAKYVTSIDLFAAYIFLIEKDTELLFAKQLKIDDLNNIVRWAKIEYPDEEEPKKIRTGSLGEGIGEVLTTGWTYETKKYTVSFSSIALGNKPLILGREAEFRQLIETLIKIENNNVLLVGNIGAGKENLVRAFSYYSFTGELGGLLNYKKVLQLLTGALTAGASQRGDLEVRLQEIIAEISHAENVLIYIPDIENILGGASYNLDLSGALLPYLKTGNLPVVATMTTGAYKTYMEKNPIKEAFTVISLSDPGPDVATQMVLSEAKKIEKKYNAIITYGAVKSSVELAGRFLQDQVLPGSAVSLLETVANKVALDKNVVYFEHTKKKAVLKDHVVSEVETEAHVAIGTPSDQEIELLLHLEERLHARVIHQDEAITAISEAMRRVRSGMSTSERPVSFLFLGPTGVGKTETAKALADFYFGGVKNMIRLDMSEYSDDAGVRRLLGALPGEGQERGELTDKIHDNPASLVLLDEFEKANPKIHNLFLQVLDDGRLTDNKGVTVSFRNAIIIATSNAGSEFIREEVGKGVAVDKSFQRNLLEHLQTNRLFKPELLNRFDDVVTFKPLANEDVIQVVKLMLGNLIKTMAEQDIVLAFDDAVIEKISKEGFDAQFGARPLKRYIQDNLEDIIAQKKLTKELDRGKRASFSIDGTGALTVTIS